MDALKVGTYSNTPASLERGCSDTQSLHPETCKSCSVLQSTQSRGRRSFLTRPWVVLGIVTLTWLAFSYGKRAFSLACNARYSAGDNMEFELQEDEDHGHRCVNSADWTTYYDQPSWRPDYPHGAEATFSLPLDSDALHLISRGGLQHGTVNIEQSTQVGGMVDVRVQVAYHNDHALKHATVCRLERADKKYGVGIFTRPPYRHALENQLQFDVTLTLPATNEGPLSIKKLATRMPDYSQTVADLQESVLFDTISLASVNGRLNVQSVTSGTGHFSSTNGEIEGNFNAQSSLTLSTVNGRITPTVNMLHHDGTGPSNLMMHTVNGQVNAEVSLSSEASVGGEFQVDAKTVNGEIGLKFTQTPVDSVLRCRAETVSGDAQVELDSAFEGTYTLQTVFGKKFVSQQDVEDPAGRGRHRVISLNKVIGRVGGDVRWVEKDGSSSGNEGYVTLKTVASSLKLIL